MRHSAITTTEEIEMALNTITMQYPDGTFAKFASLLLMNRHLPDGVRLTGDHGRIYKAKAAETGQTMPALMSADLVTCSTPEQRATAWAAVIAHAKAQSHRVRMPNTPPAPQVLDSESEYVETETDEPTESSPTVTTERSTDPVTSSSTDQDAEQSDASSDADESTDSDADSAESESEQAQERDEQREQDRQSQRDAQSEQPPPNPMEAALEPFIRRVVQEMTVDHTTRAEVIDLDAVTLGRAVRIARALSVTMTAPGPQVAPTAPVAPSPTTLPVVAPDMHPMAGKVIALAFAGANVLMVGGAGVGKTTLAEQIAQRAGLPFYALSLTAGASESWLLGRSKLSLDPNAPDYIASRFVIMCRQPGVILLDEMDGADSNMLLIVNTAIAQRWFFNPISGERVDLHPQCMILAAANTWGTGATIKFRGRSPLDLATLDRFYAFELPRNRALEFKATGREVPADAIQTPWKATAKKGDDKRMGDWLDKVRPIVESALPNRQIEARAYIRAGLAYRAGVGLEEFKRDFFGGWRADEVSKVPANLRGA